MSCNVLLMSSLALQSKSVFIVFPKQWIPFPSPKDSGIVVPLGVHHQPQLIKKQAGHIMSSYNEFQVCNILLFSKEKMYRVSVYR